MTKKKIKIIIFTLFIIIGVVGVTFYVYHQLHFQSVYIASHQLNQRSKITKGDLSEVKLPRAFIPENVYYSNEKVENKYVKLTFTIPKGSFIYKTALETTSNDLAYKELSKGEVAYDIYANQTKANLASLAKNMSIDLYLTINDNKHIYSDLLLENARIIGIYDNEGRLLNNNDQANKVGIISIALDKKDVTILNQAFLLGEVKIIVNSETYLMGNKTKLHKDSKVYEKIVGANM